jgi:hypothetical protein
MIFLEAALKKWTPRMSALPPIATKPVIHHAARMNRQKQRGDPVAALPGRAYLVASVYGQIFTFDVTEFV